MMTLLMTMMRKMVMTTRAVLEPCISRDIESAVHAGAAAYTGVSALAFTPHHHHRGGDDHNHSDDDGNGDGSSKDDA